MTWAPTITRSGWRPAKLARADQSGSMQPHLAAPAAPVRLVAMRARLHLHLHLSLAVRLSMLSILAATALSLTPWSPARATAGNDLSGQRLDFAAASLAVAAFAGALAGYVEATRESAEDKNRLCPPSPYGNSLAGWVRMQVLGGRAAAAFNSEPDIREWAHGCALNPARIRPERRDDPAVQAVIQRVQSVSGPGMARMAQLAGMASA